MKLTADKVEEIFMDCLFRDEEIVKGVPIVEPVKVVGIVHNYGFHPQRLEAHKNEVKELLTELPKEFHKASGGGMSFLNACVDKEGTQWGQHMNMEQLFCLGIGLQLCAFSLPREFWSSLPGGMPYITIL